MKQYKNVHQYKVLNNVIFKNKFQYSIAKTNKCVKNKNIETNMNSVFVSPYCPSIEHPIKNSSYKMDYNVIFTEINVVS